MPALPASRSPHPGLSTLFVLCILVLSTGPLLSGCALHAPQPGSGDGHGAVDRLLDASGEVRDPPPRTGEDAALRIPTSMARSWLPTVGTPTTGGVATSAHMARAYHARLAGDSETAIAAVEQEIASLGATADDNHRWWVHMTYARLLIEQLQVDRARTALAEVRVLERRVFQAELVSDEMLADIAVLERDLDAARGLYRQVLKTLDGRGARIPMFASAEQRRLHGYWLEARSRSIIGMGLSYLLEKRCDRALGWLQHAHREFTPLIELPNTFPFSLFVRGGPDLQQGYGWVLALLGAARTCHDRTLTGNEALFEAALAYFASVDLHDGPLIVASLLEHGALAGGALPGPSRQIGRLDLREDRAETTATESSLLARLPNAG
ncbi:MAG: hypothetical protein KDK91_21665, partial [Gammaproteobacteria bacterium]|nr:hypothetical protein [Gammaproteobacteria bacterium]